RDIKPMNALSEAILGLNPVTFQYKSDPADAGPQFGLIAEEVAKVNPNLVVRDQKGEIYTVRYDSVNVMLLNEFLKQHCKMEEQEATIARLKQDFQSELAEQQKQIKMLTSALGQVSDRIGLNKPAPRVALKHR